MKDYISREAALAFQDELAVLLCKDVVTGDVMSATKDADLVKYLLYIPAADVRPVVKARWKPVMCAGNPNIQDSDEWYGRLFGCGECNCTMIGKSNFCPNCGADMREES